MVIRLKYGSNKTLNWLTDNMPYSLSRQVGEESAEEGANEGVLQESHVLVRAGGVQQTGNCRDQIGEKIHLWNILFLSFDHFTFIHL